MVFGRLNRQAMIRKLFYAVGLMVFAAGVFALLRATLLFSLGKLGFAIYFWSAAMLLLAGWIIASFAKNRTCRDCLHRFDAKALICPHCGGVPV